MSILRQVNYLAGMRVDVPTLRSIESGTAGDFDMVLGRQMAGSAGYVVRGLTIITTGTTGQPATALNLVVADSILVNLNASVSGSMLWVPTTQPNELLTPTNANTSGGFTAGTTNYIGIDLTRTANAATSDLEEFLDANTFLEFSKQVPLALTMGYTIVIGTRSFSSQPNLVPIAIVTTDSNNNVLTITDARPMLYRLGSGGTSPNSGYFYSYPGGQFEDTDTTGFGSGDKQFQSEKDWKNAVMTRLWQIGGGEYWYGPTADRNVTMCGSGATFSSGDYFNWDGTYLTWQNLTLLFDSASQGVTYYNTVNNQTTNVVGVNDLADGQCIYVDLQRNSSTLAGIAVTASKCYLTQLWTQGGLGGTAQLGNRYVLAWRRGSSVFSRGSRLPVGALVAAATTASNGIVTLNATPASSTNPVVLSVQAGGVVSFTALNAAAPGNAFAVTGGTATTTGNQGGNAVYGLGGAGLGAGVGGYGTYGQGGAAGTTGVGGTGAFGFGGLGGSTSGVSGNGVSGQGANSNSAATIGGRGVFGTGGTGGTTGQGGYGVYGFGGVGGSTSGQTGIGVGGVGANSGTNTVAGGIGGQFAGGNGLTTGNGGAGVTGNGGTAGATSGTFGGDGVVGGGGTSTGTAQGGNGIRGSGGTAGATGQGGAGGSFSGAVGGATSGQGGQGVYATGGGGTAAGTAGGPGGQFVGGGPGSGGVGGPGVYASGGSNSGNGAMLLANGQAASADTNAGVVGVTGTGSGVIGRATGAGLAVQGIGGNIQCDSSYDYKYSSPKTYMKVIPAQLMLTTNSSGTIPGGANGNQPQWAPNGAVNMNVSCALVGIPQGATVTQLGMVVNNLSGSSQSWTYNVGQWVGSSFSTIPSVVFYNAGGSAGNSVSCPTGINVVSLTFTSFAITQSSSTAYGVAYVNITTSANSLQTIANIIVYYTLPSVQPGN